MKVLHLLFLTLCGAAWCVNEPLAQNSINVNPPPQLTDWSTLFPEIPNCVRIIEPIKQDGRSFEQVALYERQDFETGKGRDPNYFGCGSIALRFAPSARKSAKLNYDNIALEPFLILPQKTKVKTFDAYRDSPQCGNDRWIGSTVVYFDEHMSLTVSANMNAPVILEFAETADYGLLKKTIGKFVKSRN